LIETIRESGRFQDDVVSIPSFSPIREDEPEEQSIDPESSLPADIFGESLEPVGFRYLLFYCIALS
jgi:hypothetical protein